MNKIRVIDLLNKIANGEEVPKEIIFENYRYHKHPEGYFRSVINSNWIALTTDFNIYDILNDEVEIIEEPQEHKIPKKLIPTSLRGIDNLDEKIEVAHIDTISAIDKINEIIDYLNKEN